MNVHRLHGAPPPELSRALERFEEQFTYPLGPGRSFRISHRDDYPRFFRAMGEAACFVAEREGRVLGVLGASLRHLRMPGGEEEQVAYLGDLKIDPTARGGRALPQMAQAASRWLESRARAGFGVVMDGTLVTPPSYTGRLGIPLFQELGKVMVLRLSTSDPGTDEHWEAEADRGEECFARLSAGCYSCPGGFPGERSETTPLWLVGSQGEACGRLEDTMRAKRLIADDGDEMRSAHLSCFAYRDVRAGVELLRVARRRARSRGFPALFVAVAAMDAAAFREALVGTEVVLAPATVFGAGLQPGLLWNVNTAEI